MYDFVLGKPQIVGAVGLPPKAGGGFKFSTKQSFQSLRQSKVAGGESSVPVTYESQPSPRVPPKPTTKIILMEEPKLGSQPSAGSPDAIIEKSTTLKLGRVNSLDQNQGLATERSRVHNMVTNLV